MSAAARVRLEDAGRVPELNRGCDLMVEPGANSAGHPSRSDARGSVVEERARAGPERAERLQADSSELYAVLEFGILGVCAGLGERSCRTGCLCACRDMGEHARMTNCRVPRPGTTTRER